MAEKRQHDVVIIGAGPAGLTAGMYAGRSMLDAVIIERGAAGGELLNTELIEDYPGFERILGWELAQKMEQHALKFGARIEQGNVTAIRRLDDGTFESETDAGDVTPSQAVILTAGGTPVKLGIPGEKEFAGKGVSYCAVCDGAFFKGQTIAVVGGGDAAVEEANYLTRFAEKVYVIHRRDTFRASKILQERLFNCPKIEVIWDTVVDAIDGGDGSVRSLKLRNVKTDERSDLPVTGIFIFVGFKPNTGMLGVHVDHDAMGYIRTDTNMETSVPGLFAAGDLRAQLTRQITTAAGDATTATIAVEKLLAERQASVEGMRQEVA